MNCIFKMAISLLLLSAILACEDGPRQNMRIAGLYNIDPRNFVSAQVQEVVKKDQDTTVQLDQYRATLPQGALGDVDAELILRKLDSPYGLEDEAAMVLRRGESIVEASIVYAGSKRPLPLSALSKSMVFEQKLSNSVEPESIALIIASAQDIVELSGDLYVGDYADQVDYFILENDRLTVTVAGDGTLIVRSQLRETLAMVAATSDITNLPDVIAPYPQLGDEESDAPGESGDSTDASGTEVTGAGTDEGSGVSGEGEGDSAGTTGDNSDGDSASGGSSSDGSGSGDSNLSCDGLAGGVWIPVPANPDVGQNEDFCVMKYQAKLHDGTAIVADGNHSEDNHASFNARSVPEGRPWVNIKRTDAGHQFDAERACSKLGIDDPTHTYTLISNAMWQTIARNIETAEDEHGNYLNWSGDPTLAATALNRGHSNGTASLEASSDDTLGCTGLGTSTYNSVDPGADCGGGWHLNKRTHTLSSGEVIWDISGNVFQWVLDDNSISQGSDNWIYLEPWNGSTGTQAKWGPTQSYSNKTSAPFGGLGDGRLNGSSGTVVRGGWWLSDDGAGPFALALLYPANDWAPWFGFRCAALPAP